MCRVVKLTSPLYLPPTLMNTWSFIFLFHTFSCLFRSRNIVQTRVTMWLVGLKSLSQVRSSRSPGCGQGREGCILFPFTFPGSQLVQASRSVTARQWAFWLLPRDVVMRSTPFTGSIVGGCGRTALGVVELQLISPCGSNYGKGSTGINTFFGYFWACDLALLSSCACLFIKTVQSIMQVSESGCPVLCSMRCE